MPIPTTLQSRWSIKHLTQIVGGKETWVPDLSEWITTTHKLASMKAQFTGPTKRKIRKACLLCYGYKMAITCHPYVVSSFPNHYPMSPRVRIYSCIFATIPVFLPVGEEKPGGSWTKLCIGRRLSLGYDCFEFKSWFYYLLAVWSQINGFNCCDSHFPLL